MIKTDLEPRMELQPRGRAWPLRKPLATAVLLLGAFFFAYGPVLLTIASECWRSNVYSYGFLILPISLFLVWTRRKQLLGSACRPNRPAGLAVLLLGLLTLLAGHAGSMLKLEELSMVVTLMGVVLLVLGTRHFKILFLPMAYLLFMLPVWDSLTDHFHSPFQLLSAALGSRLLNAYGILAVQHGTLVEMPQVTLEVGRECSGVNYLIAVIAMGVPLAYLCLRPWWARALLLLFAVLIAILSNALRVALIGALSHHDLAGEIHGPFHVLQGIFVSVVGYLALFAGVWVLSRLQPRKPEVLPGERRPAPAALPHRSRQAVALSVCASVLLILVGSHVHFYKGRLVPPRLELRTFPFQLGEWQGREAVPFTSIYRSLGVDHELSRIYQHPSGEKVHLYLAYFERQEQDKEVIHVKTAELHRDAVKTTLLTRDGKELSVNKVILKDKKKTVLFWYDLDGTAMTRRYLVKACMTLSSLLRGRTNAAVVMLATDASGESVPGIPDTVQDFVSNLSVALKEYLPRS